MKHVCKLQFITVSSKFIRQPIYYLKHANIDHIDHLFINCNQIAYSYSQLSKTKNNINLMSVPIKQAFKLISQNATNPKFKIIDVRTQSERNSIHIPNSQHIPLNDLQKNLNQFSPDQTYLVYCRSGARSNTATTWLNSRGFKAINMEGGINEWEKQNGESVKSASNEGSTEKNEKGCEIY